MFGLFSKKSNQQFALQMRRLIDRTSAWRLPEYETRTAARCKRTLPIFYAAWCGAPITAQEVKAGVCVDLSDSGMRLLFLEASESVKYLVSFATVAEKRLEFFSFIVEKKHQHVLAPSIYSIGMSITKYVEQSQLGPGMIEGLETLLDGSDMLQEQLRKHI
jgi:hypothetical protein